MGHGLVACCAVQSVLSWQRARIACFTAHDGQAWTDIIAQHNSGTGNNQWMASLLDRVAPSFQCT